MMACGLGIVYLKGIRLAVPMILVGPDRMVGTRGTWWPNTMRFISGMTFRRTDCGLRLWNQYYPSDNTSNSDSEYHKGPLNSTIDFLTDSELGKTEQRE